MSPIPGPVSRLGFVVDAPALGGRAAERSVIERVRRARHAGIDLFDVASVPDPIRSARLVASALADSEAGSVLLVPARAVGLASALREEGGGRPAPFHLFREEGGSSEEAADRATAEDGVRRLEGPEAELPPSRSGRYVGPFSLLDRRLASRFGAADRTGSARLWARDPFARGRLDGSRFGPTAPTGERPERPASVRDLAEEFAPVLRLGFLTEGRHRTLVEAAIQYLLAHRWVEAVLAPLPPIERLEAVVRSLSAQPLTPAELARIAADRPPERGPSGPVK